MKTLLVGHCFADRFSLSRAVRRALPEAEVEGVNSDAELERHLDGAALLLVNRALTGRFSARDGVTLIGALAGRARCVLVSNFADAQGAAEAAGALPGFGKSDLGSDETARRIRAAAGA